MSFKQGESVKKGCKRVVRGLGGAAAIVAATAGPAVAAGSGYGPTPPSNTIPPAGFTSIVKATTVGSRGGTVRATAPGGRIAVAVPHGAWGQNDQVVITRGANASVSSGVAKVLKKDRVLAAFGLQLKHGAADITARKSLTVTFRARTLRPDDVVVAYDPRTHRFTKVRARVAHGVLVVRVTRSTSIAVLAPVKARHVAPKRKVTHRKGALRLTTSALFARHHWPAD